MSDWNVIPIKQLGRVVTGKTPPTGSAEYYGGDELFVSPKDLTRDSCFVSETETKITTRALEKFKGQVIPKNSVMFTSLCFAFGKMGITTRPCITNQQINTIVPNGEHNYRFVYYLLRTYESIIFSYNSGIDTPIVPKSVFEKIQIRSPDLDLQEKIAAVLSAYDDLIDNNRRRTELLERMAEELYREWFVRFRFPGYQQVTFEKTVPQGWEPQKLGDLCHLIRRGIAPKYSDDSPKLVINQRCIRNGGVDLSAARQHDTKVPVEKIIQHADVLINSTGVGTLGRVSVVEFEPNNLTCDTHVTICRANPKKVNPYFLACTVARLQQHFENLAVGSTGQTELGRDEIAKVKILLPPEDLQAEFAKRISSFWMIKIALTDSLKNLAEQRDQLLTRLISGKLPVDQLDIQFPPSMREAAAARQEVAHA